MENLKATTDDRSSESMKQIGDHRQSVREETTTCSENEIRQKYLESESVQASECPSYLFALPQESVKEEPKDQLLPRVSTPDTRRSYPISPSWGHVGEPLQASATSVYSLRTPKLLSSELSKSEACMLDHHRHLFRGIQRLYYGADAVKGSSWTTSRALGDPSDRTRRRRPSVSKAVNANAASSQAMSAPTASLNLKAIGASLGSPISMTQEKAAVMVIGNMCAGKSTFINWFVGDSLLRTGMCTETAGFTYISSGRSCVEFSGESTLKYRKHLEVIANEHPGFVKILSLKTSPKVSSRLHLVDLIDTPGLVDGEVDYGCNIEDVMVDMRRFVDLYFVFFDPIGQALGKRVTSVVKRLNEYCPEKLRFCLSKIDEVPTEEERIKVMCQTTQSLTSKIHSRHAFDLIPVYIPGARHGTYLSTLEPEHESLVNRLMDLVCAINRVTLQRVHNLLDSVVADIGVLESRVSRELELADTFRKQMKMYRSAVARSRLFRMFTVWCCVTLVVLQLWDTFSPIHLSPLAVLLARWVNPEHQEFFHHALGTLALYLDTAANWIRRGRGFGVLWFIVPALLAFAFRSKRPPVDETTVKDSTLQEYREYLKAARSRVGELYSSYSTFAMDDPYAASISNN